MALSATVSPWDYGYEPNYSDPSRMEKDLDTDEVMIINAFVFVRNDMGEVVLREAASFVYKHPKAPPIEDLASWRDELGLMNSKLADLVAPSCASPLDLQNYWGYDRLKVHEYHTEMEIIYAFQDYLHAQDVDVVTGWNIDFFDFPFLFKRWIHHCKVLGEYDLPQPNFGYLVGGCSKLSTFKSDRPKGPKVTEGASVKKGKSYDSVTLKHLCMIDGLAVWNANYADFPHTLNSVSSKNLDHPVGAVSAAAHLALKKGTDFFASRDEPLPEEELCRFAGASTLTDLLRSAQRDPDGTLNRATHETLRDKVAGEFSDAGGKRSFPMKKVEFKHENGERYWKSGGHDLLRFVLYCAIDCILPVLLLKLKGVMFSQLSFSMITGLKLDDILGKGQQAKVNMILLRACKQMNGGEILPHDKGYHHLHWPCVFRHPLGCRRAVLMNIDRLKPPDGKQRNEGGLVQKPFEYGLVGGGGMVVTKDAASMYPTRLETSNLCSTRFLTSELIAEKNVPRYRYAKITLGSAEDNFCGERVCDHETALEIGCNTDDLKQTFFHQQRGAIMPGIVVDLAAKRASGKNAKALWFAIYEHCENVLLEERTLGGFPPARDGSSLCTLDGYEFCQKMSDFSCKIDAKGPDDDPRERLLRHLGLSDAVEYLRTHGEETAEMVQFSRAVELLKSNVVLVHLLKRLGSFRVACPSGPGDLNKAAVLLMLNTVKSLAVLSAEEKTFRVLLKLSRIQYENFELYQLEVKRAMNSMYGILMRANGAFALPEIGASITSLGRRTISEVKCIAERQTTEYAKRCMGFAADSEKSDPSLKSSVVAFGKDNPRYVFAGGILRRLHRFFVRTFYDSLRVEELIKGVYGDTDSIMSLFAKHSVVNVEQAFAVLLFLVQIINSYCAFGYSTPRMTKFEDEKISRKTVIYQQKRYDMYATYKIEKSVVKLLPAGSNKSDTLPFLNELMSRTSEEFLVNLEKGYSAKEATNKLVFEIKKRLLEFAMEKIDPEELTTTTKLSKFDPSLEVQSSVGGKIAARMLARGEPVCAGDRVTYLSVRNRFTGEISLEEYGHFLRNMDTLAPDLLLIWETKVKNKLVAFLRHLLCPLNDMVLLDTVYLDRETENNSAQSVQLEIQSKYLSRFVFAGPGDLERRLEKRRRMAEESHGFSARNAFFGKKSTQPCQDAVYPKEIECLSCFRFFDPKVYVVHRRTPDSAAVLTERSGLSNLLPFGGNSQCSLPRSAASSSSSNKSRGGKALKAAATKRKQHASSHLGSSSLLQSWLVKVPPSDEKVQPEFLVKKESSEVPSGTNLPRTYEIVDGSLSYEELLRKGESVHLIFGDDCESENRESSLSAFGGPSCRRHVTIEYEGDLQEKETRYVLSHLGNHRKVCPSCYADEATIVPVLQKKHRAFYGDFVEARAVCMICIEFPQVPPDREAPDTPETCTMTVCENYKRKKELSYFMGGVETELAAFEAVHASW